MLRIIEVDCKNKECDDSKVFTGKNLLNLKDACDCNDGQTGDCSCGTYVTIETVGDFRALFDAAKFNYLVIGGVIEMDTLGLAHIPITDQLDGFPPETPFSDFIGSDFTFQFFSCDVNILLADATPSECDCSPVIVTTVGELLARATRTYNFIDLILFNGNFGSVVMESIQLGDDTIAYLQGLEPDTLLTDAFAGSLVDDADFIRFSSCDTNIADGISGGGGGSDPAITDVTGAGNPCEHADNDRAGYGLSYSNIPIGSTLLAYGLVSGIETVLIQEFIINDINGEAATHYDFTEVANLDYGTNHVRFVITLPDTSTLEATTSNFMVNDCSTPPVKSLTITNVESECTGNIGESALHVTIEYANLSAGELKIFALIGGVDSPIYDDPAFAGGTGTLTVDFNSDADWGTGGDGNSHVYATADTDSLQTDNYDFTCTCATDPSLVEILDTTNAYCDGSTLHINYHLRWTNVQDGTAVQVFMLTGGIDQSIALIVISPAGSNPDFSDDPFLMPIDAGANHIKIVVTNPDLSTYEQTFPITVPTCS